MSIVVVGDVLLDVDMSGSSERLSPDAPVPVIDVSRTVHRPGGAGLVATMLRRDGEDARLVTAMPDDERAQQLRRGLGSVPVVSSPSGAPTPVKTRLSAAGQAVARIDEGCAPAPAPQVTAEMIASVETADALIVADYGRGLTANPRLREALLRRGREVPLVWDPHPRGAEPVSSATAVTPNLGEALAAAGVTGDGIDATARAANALRHRWGCTAVAVTLGEHGALLSSGDGPPLMVPAPRVAVADPCGAGDRLAASLVSGLRAGVPLAEALGAAVDDAARFLAAGGVATMAVPANTAPMGGMSGDALRIARLTRARGGTVVATGGCFDLLHAGHARTLSAARALGDCLIVCLNSDSSVRRLKGPERPIVEQDDRAELLLSLECVDAVLVFDEDTPEEVIRRLRPELWVKGGDYLGEELPEARLLSSWGGRVVTVPFYYPGRSTTRLASALARVG